jgi:hypothetical protein
MDVLENFDKLEESRRSSTGPSAAAKPEPEPKTDLRQVADELAEQHLDWAKRRPADYEVPY